mgnify:CR=1 FL=1
MTDVQLPSRDALEPPEEPPRGLFGSIKDACEEWVLSNYQSVGFTETGLKTALYLLPGRFTEQEMISEVGV